MYDNAMNRSNYTLRTCKEIISFTSVVFYFTKNFYLVNEFSELIQRFDSAGLIAQILSKYGDAYSTNKIQKNAPSALTYQNIEGFFILFYAGCVLASISFVCEIVRALYESKKYTKFHFQN